MLLTESHLAGRGPSPVGRSQTKQLMGEVLQEAHFSYAQVVYVAGDVGYALRE